MGIIMLVQPICYNATIATTNDLGTLLNLLNQSPCLMGTGSAGYLGFAISLFVLVLATMIFTYRLKPINALLAGAFFGLLVSLLLVTLGIESPAVVMLMVSIMILSAVVALTNHVLNPFSD